MKLRPSNIARSLACPASAALAASNPHETGSVYADEGTAAHTVGELALREGNDAGHYVGLTLNGVDVTAEMAQDVQHFIDYVRSVAKPGSDMRLEQRIDVNHLGENFDGGTIDVLLIVDVVLHIVDYKHGAGVLVDVHQNKQLLTYAVIACEKLGYDFREIVLSIVQPRVSTYDGPLNWTVSPDTVRQFRNELVSGIATANEAAAEIQRDSVNGELVVLPNRIKTGTHCQFCPALSLCPLQQSIFQTVQKMSMTNLKALEPSQRKYVLDNIANVNKFMKATTQFAEAEFLAGREGAEGYKLVRRWGNRRFKVDAEGFVNHMASYLAPWDCTKLFSKSPAQIEKRLDADGKKALAEITERPEIGVKVVPVSSGGEAINRKPANQEFEPVTN